MFTFVEIFDVGSGPPARRRVSRYFGGQNFNAPQLPCRFAGSVPSGSNSWHNFVKSRNRLVVARYVPVSHLRRHKVRSWRKRDFGFDGIPISHRF
jgi:hypothetical protein